MQKMALALMVVGLVGLPSCMHPAEQAFNARHADTPCLVDAQGRISQGACDRFGRYASDKQLGLTLSAPAASSPRLAAGEDLQPQ